MRIFFLFSSILFFVFFYPPPSSPFFWGWWWEVGREAVSSNEIRFSSSIYINLGERYWFRRKALAISRGRVNSNQLLLTSPHTIGEVHGGCGVGVWGVVQESFLQRGIEN